MLHFLKSLSLVLLIGFGLRFESQSQGSSQPAFEFDVEGSIYTLAFRSVAICPDSSCIVYGNSLGEIYLQDMNEDVPAIMLTDLYSKHEFPDAAGILWNEDEPNYVVFVPPQYLSGNFEVWKFDGTIHQPRLSRLFSGFIDQINEVWWMPNGSDLLISSYNKPETQVWSASTQKLQTTLPKSRVVISEDSHYIAAYNDMNDDNILVFDNTYKQIFNFTPSSFIVYLHWVGDEGILVSHERDGLNVWDVKNKKLIGSLSGRYGIVFPLNNTEIMTEVDAYLSDSEPSIIVWDFKTSEMQQKFIEGLYLVRYSSDQQKFLYTTSSVCSYQPCDDTIYVNTYSNLDNKSDCNLVLKALFNILFIPDVPIIVAIQGGGFNLLLISPTTCQVLREISHEERFNVLLTSMDKRYFLTATSQTVYIWDIAEFR